MIEINAAVFSKRLSEKYGKLLPLAEIPQKEWQSFAAQGYHFVWCMGVWKRSPAARQCALSEPALRADYQRVLPDYQDKDVAGSPYAVYDYSGNEFSGSLPGLKKNLQEAGLKLIVDYVPNHLALDHPWTASHPECFVGGSKEDAQRYPELFFQTAGKRFFAHGKDPHFAPWTDTIQINYFSEAARSKSVETILGIAQSADGVRCDMAMLGIHRIFKNTWGKFIQHSEPVREFWREIIQKVREKYPDFIFIAEAYWDTEWELQQMGFDFTYDKKLYERLLYTQAQEIRAHLEADRTYQDRSVRFIENHDEPRAAEVFGTEKSKAAAAVIATIPGLRFFHDGQAEGKKIKIPIQLIREPREKEDRGIAGFYQKLLAYTQSQTFQEGIWQLCGVFSSGGNDGSWVNLLSWSWADAGQVRVIVINYSSEQAYGRIFFQSERLPPGVVKLKDALTGENYERETQEIKQKGLFVGLGPWKAHCFEITV